MNSLYISASNMIGTPRERSTSYKICEIASGYTRRRDPGGTHSILELKHRTVLPCIGCGKCWGPHRCVLQDDFNDVYEQVIGSDVVVFVSPHYAPIPAKLAALLERMEAYMAVVWADEPA